MCEEILNLQRQLLQKLYYQGQPVATDSALKDTIDALIEQMLAIFTSGCDIDRQWVSVDVTTASETVIPGTPGYYIRVIDASLTADATTEFTFNSGVGAAVMAVWGDENIDIDKQYLLPPSGRTGWFECETGEDLIITKTGGNIGGGIGYILIEADTPS